MFQEWGGGWWWSLGKGFIEVMIYEWRGDNEQEKIPNGMETQRWCWMGSDWKEEAAGGQRDLHCPLHRVPGHFNSTMPKHSVP